MSDTPVPDFTKDEIRVIQDTLKERYGHAMEIELAEAEMRLNPALTEMTLCPIVYWEVGDCHFVVAKVDKYHFMNHFYYRLYQTYATEKRRYDDVLDCVVSLLRAQADYELKEQGVTGKK
ncbi:MAG: hypothetical protein GC149_10500 [Gammaproteobacteria bacterium]|nr:hypothetical protein [Gammaproteobacteria bacterium]